MTVLNICRHQEAGVFRHVDKPKAVRKGQMPKVLVSISVREALEQ